MRVSYANFIVLHQISVSVSHTCLNILFGLRIFELHPWKITWNGGNPHPFETLGLNFFWVLTGSSHRIVMNINVYHVLLIHCKPILKSLRLTLFPTKIPNFKYLDISRIVSACKCKCLLQSNWNGLLRLSNPYIYLDLSCLHFPQCVVCIFDTHSGFLIRVPSTDKGCCTITSDTNKAKRFAQTTAFRSY